MTVISLEEVIMKKRQHRIPDELDPEGDGYIFYDEENAGAEIWSQATHPDHRAEGKLIQERYLFGKTKAC